MRSPNPTSNPTIFFTTGSDSFFWCCDCKKAIAHLPPKHYGAAQHNRKLPNYQDN
ncbi:hypothetical protein [Scytonema sp. HK-05]|uniref:hypothetical protein n=1 Tax=Scytonema sp. HK-05 TaxID=1137095 RepID=UPI0013010CEE|nr:hypothetical protein [Scytonema sp. HK-05]